MADAILVPSLTSWGTGDFEEIVFTYSYKHGNNNTSNEEVVASPTQGIPKFVFLYLSDMPQDTQNSQYTEWPYYPGSLVRVPLGGKVALYKYSGSSSTISVKASTSGQASIYSYRVQASYFRAYVIGSIIFLY